MSTVPTIVVKDIQISPNNCLLQEKLNLTVIFEIDGVINKGWWHTKVNFLHYVIHTRL